MARVWQRYIGPSARGSSRRKPKKPKDVRVQGAGHKRRTVNAPKAW